MNSPSLQPQSSPGLDELKKNLDSLRSLLALRFLDIATPLENANGHLSNMDLWTIYSYFESLYYEKIRRVHADIVGILNKQLGSQDAKVQIPALSQVLDEMITTAAWLTKQNQGVLSSEGNHVIPTTPEYLSKLGLDYRKQLPETTIEELASFLRYLSVYIEWKEEVILAKITVLAAWISEQKRQKILAIIGKKNP